MNYFLEIKVLPDPEFKETVLMNALFSKLHRTLVAMRSTEIGVSFPDVKKKSLGTCLRLHGTLATLNNLVASGWLKGMRDYTVQTDIEPIPPDSKHRRIRRLQSKSNIDRLLRRSVAKGWLTEAEIEEKKTKMQRQLLQLPFLQLKSLSTSQTFRLFIEHGEIQSEPISGVFNAYGLSSSATVPWF